MYGADLEPATLPAIHGVKPLVMGDTNTKVFDTLILGPDMSNIEYCSRYQNYMSTFLLQYWLPCNIHVVDGELVAGTKLHAKHQKQATSTLSQSTWQLYQS